MLKHVLLAIRMKACADWGGGGDIYHPESELFDEREGGGESTRK